MRMRERETHTEEAMLVREWSVKNRDDEREEAGFKGADDEGDSKQWEGREREREKSRVPDRSNMAGSHSYFSFTLLCIRT